VEENYYQCEFELRVMTMKGIRVDLSLIILISFCIKNVR